MVQADSLQSQQLPEFMKLWDWSNVAETERRFRAIIPRAELSHDAEYLAQLLTQIARCEGLQGNFTASHATLDTVEKMIAANNLQVAHIRYCLERGRAFNSGGKPATSIPLFQKAYELAEAQKKNGLAIDAVHMIAIAESDPNDQIKWNLQGITMAEADSAQKGWLNALL